MRKSFVLGDKVRERRYQGEKTFKKPVVQLVLGTKRQKRYNKREQECLFRKGG